MNLPVIKPVLLLFPQCVESTSYVLSAHVICTTTLVSCTIAQAWCLWRRPDEWKAASVQILFACGISELYIIILLLWY